MDDVLAKILGQVVLVVINSGVPVLVGNFLKTFFPGMNGKTGVIVNWLTAGLFVWAFVYANIYNPDLLYHLLPGIEFKAKAWIEVANGIVLGIAALGLNKPIYDWIKGKFGILGKSFSAKA